MFERILTLYSTLIYLCEHMLYLLFSVVDLKLTLDCIYSLLTRKRQGKKMVLKNQIYIACVESILSMLINKQGYCYHLSSSNPYLKNL